MSVEWKNANEQREKNMEAEEGIKSKRKIYRKQQKGDEKPIHLPTMLHTKVKWNKIKAKSQSQVFPFGFPESFFFLFLFPSSLLLFVLSFHLNFIETLIQQTTLKLNVVRWKGRRWRKERIFHFINGDIIVENDIVILLYGKHNTKTDEKHFFSLRKTLSDAMCRGGEK